MKKKIAYLTATALACVTIFGAASCGNKGGDSVADLEIYFCLLAEYLKTHARTPRILKLEIHPTTDTHQPGG